MWCLIRCAQSWSFIRIGRSLYLVLFLSRGGLFRFVMCLLTVCVQRKEIKTDTRLEDTYNNKPKEKSPREREERTWPIKRKNTGHLSQISCHRKEKSSSLGKRKVRERQKTQPIKNQETGCFFSFSFPFSFRDTTTSDSFRWRDSWDGLCGVCLYYWSFYLNTHLLSLPPKGKDIERWKCEKMGDVLTWKDNKDPAPRPMESLVFPNRRLA